MWNLIWFGVFLFFLVYPLSGTINLTRQTQKDGNSVLYQLEKSKNSCGGHYWCTLYSGILLLLVWGLRMSCFLKQKAEVFSSMILWSLSRLFHFVSLLTSQLLGVIKRKDVATGDWWCPFLAKYKAHSLPCSVSYLVSRILNSASKGHLYLMD